ncbi:MAG TPA: TonB-dependent receptor [Acidobacteriota bacterium]|nr:TonB-dependent receptor [Acidobacteriota bacterium]
MAKKILKNGYGGPLRRLSRHTGSWVAFVLGTALTLSPTPALGQQTGSIVVTAVASEGTPAFEVSVLGTALTPVASADGTARIDDLQPGTYRIVTLALGYAPQTSEVRVAAGQTVPLRVELAPLRFETPGVVVTALRPDLRPELLVGEQELRTTNPRDVGELLRGLPGVDSVRRGPLGFDPVVRGLRESEVGVYLDDARIFPAGPARMDSALSHFDPSTVRSVEVVKGPYALTWGAGNLAAIRASTASLPPAVAGAVHGTVWGGYNSNLEASEGVGQLWGSSGGTSYWLGGSHRQGNDYEDGDGNVVPADYKSSEVRGKLGIELGSTLLSVRGAYQDQRDIDNPGRLLDAQFFKSKYFAANIESAATTGTRVYGSAYFSDVDHFMDNDEKPTALANPHRTPPFPLEITVDTGSQTVGGRVAVDIDTSDSVGLELGGDLYRVNRNAIRTIRRRAGGATIAQDTPWPDADISDAGLFAKVETANNGVTLAATARLDFVTARADESLVTDFFRANATGELDSNETNLSGAITMAVPLDAHWVLSAGVGSAVRTADVLERYSDRFPATKAQTPAEFMGNPEIEPERGSQADLWIVGRYDRVAVNASGFYRRIDNYITLEPTDLPKKLPLSPPVVFRYVNAKATFWGFESNLVIHATDNLALSASASYLRGTDDRFDEPALGITPFSADFSARFEPSARWHAQGVFRVIGDQNRVATRRGETATEGTELIDLDAGWRTGLGFEINAGVLNLANRRYVNHLNAKNPFLRAAVPEPGRVVYARAVYSF